MKAIKQLYKKLVLRNLYANRAKKNLRGTEKHCVICDSRFSAFLKYEGGSANVPDWHKKIEPVGSDLDNFGCPVCNSSDRLRHLYMYFDKLDFWANFDQAEVLHFAPESILRKKIQELNVKKYVMADYYPTDDEILKVDIVDIPFDDNSFDLVICNHVLEHIPDYNKAMSELYRVTKPRGFAILQTPYSTLLHHNFEDEGINTEELRLLYYGQTDHVRYFSENDFMRGLEDAGFKRMIVEHSEVFEENLYKEKGVNKLESLIRVMKPLD